MSTVVDLKDADQYFGMVGREVRAAAKAGLLSAAMRAVTVIVTQIIPSRSPSPVDRGVYRAGWKFRALANGAMYFNNEEHALFVEGGVRAENVKPGESMIAALTKWVMRKGLNTKFRESQVFVRRSKTWRPRAVKVGGNRTQRAKNVAWAIARVMQKKGIFNGQGGKGLGIMREMNERYIGGIVNQEIASEIARRRF